MKLNIILFSLSFFFTLSSCSNQNKQDKAAEKKFIELDGMARRLFSALPEPEKLDSNQITLGKKLYFDNRLSKDNVQSCNTCHNVNTFGVDNKPTSAGNHGEFGVRNSPTTFNAALHFVQFWDGREETVESQAGQPILNSVEMAMPSKKAVVNKLKNIEEYQVAFEVAFPDEKNPISYDNIQNAIGAYERQLITPGRFDEYLNGNDDALTNEEKEGLNTYINTGCTTCHSGSLLGGNMYQKFGLYDDYWVHTKSEKIDEGRYEVTGDEGDKYIFKTPSLRNVEKTEPYFHDGSVKSLKEAVKIMAKTQNGKDISDKQANEIVTFLNTLTSDIPDHLK